MARILHPAKRAAHGLRGAGHRHGLVLRWIWMLADSPLLYRRATKSCRTSSIRRAACERALLVAIIGFGPNAAWLSAKIGALVVYIVLGTLALKRGRGARRVRRARDRYVRVHRVGRAVARSARLSARVVLAGRAQKVPLKSRFPLSLSHSLVLFP